MLRNIKNIIVVTGIIANLRSERSPLNFANTHKMAEPNSRLSHHYHKKLTKSLIT